MHNGGGLRKVVGIALQFERGAPANYERRIVENGLEGDDDLLPAQSAARPAEHAAGGLFKPPRFHILMLELRGITLGLEPCGIDKHSLGKLAGELV